MAQREINFLEDDPSTMTSMRRVALYLMRRYRWYNPRLGEEGEEDAAPDKAAGGSDGRLETEEVTATFDGYMLCSTQRERPSLAEAWAYYEHWTLPRYLDHSAASLATSPSGQEIFAGDEPIEQAGTSAEEVKLLGGSARPGYGAGSDGATSRNSTPSEKSVHSYLPSLWQRPMLPRVMVMAEAGQNRRPSRLYSPLWTPVDQMGDFGMGIGLYFCHLRSIAILSLIAGLINIPNMIYFASKEYSQGQEGVSILLRGSAACTVQEYVPCPTCTMENFLDTPQRVAVSSLPHGDKDLLFVMKNFCDGAKLPLAFVNNITLLFLIFGMACINRYLRGQGVVFDEDEQTAQDYSIVVTNPPPDATNPDEWKAFFEDDKFGPGVHVTCCTIARDNSLLVKALVRRREILHRLKWELPPGTTLDAPSLNKIQCELEGKRSLFERAMSLVSSDAPSLIQQLKETISEVERLSSKEFPATRVFVTFETEMAQRAVLECLSVSFKAVLQNDVHAVDPGHLFRSRLVLNTEEAAEPSTIRWLDLSDIPLRRFVKLSLTAFVWACSIALVAFIVRLCRHRGPTFVGFVISFFSSACPEFAKILVNYESHPSEGLRQASHYFKITGFRWANTAIIVTITTPFTSTLSSGQDYNLLDGVSAIFFAEIITENVTKLVDPTGLIYKHFLAPRSRSQEEMNNYMRGDNEFFLAERYSSMSTIFFLALWYSALYPFGFFFCSIALFINRYSERFSLMRTWEIAPRFGRLTSVYSQRFVFPMLIAAMGVASSYFWAGFTYDNLCENDDTGSDSDAIKDYVGTYVVSADGSQNVEVTVSEETPSYHFCQQSFWYGKGIDFPAIPYWQNEGEEWMTKEQELLARVCGWSSLFLLIGACLCILKNLLEITVLRPNYKPHGKVQGIAFSNVAIISSYIPQVKSEVFPYPLLAVDTDDVYEELYEWKDPYKPYSYHDLTRDAKHILKDSMPDHKIKLLFSTLTHWPPDQGEYKK